MNSKWIKEVIEKEIAILGGNSKKVYIGGFSQGGAISLHIGLGFEKPLGAIIGLSTFKFVESKITEISKNVPVHLNHGDKDGFLPYAECKKTYE